MNRDQRSLPVSTSNQTAIDAYDQALIQFHSYLGDPLATIDRAIAESPDFVMGHLFRAGALLSFGEQRFAREAANSVTSAEKLLSGANDRERAICAAMRKAVNGDWDGACVAFDAVLVTYPRDAFVIQLAHLLDFLRGDAVNLRNRITRVMPAWSPHVPGYSYVLGMHAFGLEECNQYPEAEAAAMRALAIEAKDPWSIHAATHVMEMTGRIDEGIRFLETSARDWAPESSFAFHLWWHLALFELDRGNVGRVLELYDQRIYPQAIDFTLVLVDASALLWRLQLAGVDVRSRMQTLAQVWSSKLEAERGFYAFNDVHATMAFVGAGRDRELALLLEQMHAATDARTSNAAMVRDIGLPVARGLRAFGASRYHEAIRELEPVRDRAQRFGGSHAQRDIITQTLIEAALLAGRDDLARHYIAERTVSRPASALGWRLAARAGAR